MTKSVQWSKSYTHEPKKKIVCAGECVCVFREKVKERLYNVVVNVLVGQCVMDCECFFRKQAFLYWFKIRRKTLPRRSPEGEFCRYDIVG